MAGSAALIALASLALNACPPALRTDSPTALYEKLFWSNAGLRCYPVDDPRPAALNRNLSARFQAVRPWLVGAIGETDYDALVERLGEEDHGVYYVGCPSRARQQSDTAARRCILREMERRAKAAAQAASSSSPIGTNALRNWRALASQVKPFA